MTDIYDYKTSLDVVFNTLCDGQSEFPHGAKRELARIIQCHPTYVAQILKGSVFMSQEQALLFCHGYNFNKPQTDYFLILLNTERAGTLTLKKYYEAKREDLVSKLGKVQRALKANDLDEELEEEFFSHWDFQALYAALILYESNLDLHKIYESFGLSKDRINYILDKLKKNKVITAKEKGWAVNNTKIHFNGKNPSVRQKFHLAWRLKAIESSFMSSSKKPDNFNFSSLITLNKALHEKLIERMKKLIQEFSEDVDQLDPDSISVLNIDFFEIHKANG